jgi:hypothetical protein
MTFRETNLVKLIGKKTKSVEEIGFINAMFHQAYNKRKNLIKRIAKKASHMDSVYGWTE